MTSDKFLYVFENHKKEGGFTYVKVETQGDKRSTTSGYEPSVGFLSARYNDLREQGFELRNSDHPDFPRSADPKDRGKPLDKHSFNLVASPPLTTSELEEIANAVAGR